MDLLIILAALFFLMWIAYRGHSVILFAPVAALGAVLAHEFAFVRQLELDRLQAAVDLARHRHHALAHRYLRCEGRLRPAHQRGQHLTGLVRVVVDRLLAADHQVRLLLVAHRLEQLGHRQRLQLDVGLDQDAAVGTDRHRRAQRLLARTHAAGHRHHLGGHARFLQAHRLLDGDLVEGVHGHLDVGELHAGAIRLDADLDVVIHNPLDWDEYLHGFLSSNLPPENALRCAPPFVDWRHRYAFFSQTQRSMPFGRQQ